LVVRQEASVLAGDSELQSCNCFPSTMLVCRYYWKVTSNPLHRHTLDKLFLLSLYGFKSKRLYMRRLAKERLKTLVLLGNFPCNAQLPDIEITPCLQDVVSGRGLFMLISFSNQPHLSRGILLNG
jgi:hypothetical protein